MTGFAWITSFRFGERGKGAIERGCEGDPVAGDSFTAASKYCVDTASLRGAYRPQSEVLTEPKFARIAIEIKGQSERMVGPGGGIACRGVIICVWLVRWLADCECMLPSQATDAL